MKVKDFLILFLIIISATYFLSEANIFQRFMPRSVCMFQNKKLIDLHLVSDAAIFLAYIGIGTLLLLLFNALNKKGLPFADFSWKFGGFIICCGITHLVSVINIWVTFYWLDGITKLFTAWFSILVFLQLIKDFNKIKQLKTPAEFNELANRYNELLEAMHIHNKINHPKN